MTRESQLILKLHDKWCKDNGYPNKKKQEDSSQSLGERLDTQI